MTTAMTFVPAHARLADLRSAVHDCQGCDLFAGATQAVFSSGSTRASLVLVGETPGDIEDRRGEPFVGPAGMLLRRALAEAGIAPRSVYLTNAVKHFKFHVAAGSRRRLHDKPTRAEIVACRPWLTAELSLLRPRLIVAMGATAASSLVGPSFRVTQHRGTAMDVPELSAPLLATVHPSAVLRADDRSAAYASFLADLVAAESYVSRP